MFIVIRFEKIILVEYEIKIFIGKKDKEQKEYIIMI